MYVHDPLAPNRFSSRLISSSAFLRFFRHRYGLSLSRVPSALRFRIRLLRFTGVVTRRHYRCSSSVKQPELDQLREDNWVRSMGWWMTSSALPTTKKVLESCVAAYVNQLPPDESELEASRTQVLETFHIQPPTQSFYGQLQSFSLADGLRFFMSLSAHVVVEMGRDWSVTSKWMELAGEYMLQAVLEEYLVYGATGLSPLLEAFAFGFNPEFSPPAASSVEDEEQMTAMFRNSIDHQHHDAWEAVRQKYLQLVGDF